MDDVKREAKNRKIVLVLPTAKAIAVLKKQPSETNATLCM
jgi:hypothetical protein